MVVPSETIDATVETLSVFAWAIENWQPFIDFVVGIMDILCFIASVVVCILGVINILPHVKFKRFVNSVYTQENLIEVLKYYIHTRAQDVDPCEQEEIKENNGKYISCNLISFFLEEAFIKGSSGKYYLILADSGMGKTTFILRLFKECLRAFKNPKKIKTELIPLTMSNCLEKIKEIERPEHTILLLDALDENKDAINNCNTFFQELVSATSSFNKVVITCRTQFFPSNQEEPSYTSYIQTGRRRKKTEIVKKYLSPFTDQEVKQYLKKRFRFKFRLQKRAFNIVRKVPNVMARPLVLNWINFLCDSKEDYRYSYQIYDTIITKWIEREDLGESERNLFELSHSIANYMFKHETTTIPAQKVEEIAARKNVNLEPIIAKSRSLLNRNGQGEYKFAHRTFLEYFIVFNIVKQMQMPEKTDFLWSLSGAKRFLLEILTSSVENTNPKEIEEVEMNLRWFKKLSGVDSILEFIQNPKLRLEQNNNANGFTVEAWQTLEDIPEQDYLEIELLYLHVFHDCMDGTVHEIVPSERQVNMGLVFMTLDNRMPPTTTLEFRCVVQRTSTHKNIAEVR